MCSGSSGVGRLLFRLFRQIVVVVVQAVFVFQLWGWGQLLVMLAVSRALVVVFVLGLVFRRPFYQKHSC